MSKTVANPIPRSDLGLHDTDIINGHGHGLGVFDNRGRDRTDEMLEHMTRVQIRSTIMAGVMQGQLVEFADTYTAIQNERGAGCLDTINASLKHGCCHEAVAAAMPRVRLHHPEHPTLQ